MTNPGQFKKPKDFDKNKKEYHILRTTKYYNYERSPLDTCRFLTCPHASVYME